MSRNPWPPFTGARTVEVEGGSATYGYFTAMRAETAIWIYEDGQRHLGELVSAELAALVDGVDPQTGHWPDGYLGAFIVTAATDAQAEVSAQALHRQVQEEWHLGLNAAQAPTLRVSPGCSAWPGPAATELVFRLLGQAATNEPTVCGLYFAHEAVEELIAKHRVIAPNRAVSPH